MLKRMIGIVLMLAGCILLGIFLIQGILFPHIMGPGVLVLIGIVLCIAKMGRKTQ